MWRHHPQKKPVFLGSQKQGICDLLTYLLSDKISVFRKLCRQNKSLIHSPSFSLTSGVGKK